MTENKTEFLNPDCLPVENVSITIHAGGVVRKVKALDPHWVDKRETMVYEKPHTGSALVIGAMDAWKMKMEEYLEDLMWLLGLEYHRFWSTVMFHDSCMNTLVSFLQEADPPYIAQTVDDNEAYKLNVEIRKRVLLVFCRLATNKESKTQWMTKEYMSDLVYNKFIFTIPILWDICLMYGTDNKQHVSRLVTSVFTLQPQYESDAGAALSFVKETFKFIILQVNKNYDTDEPPNLPESFKGFGEIRKESTSKPVEKLTFHMLRDLIIHLLDTAMTLRIYIEVHPKSVEVFRKTNFVSSMVQLYEYGIPQLYEKLDELGDPCNTACVETENYIDMARSELIDTMREILAAYKNAIFSGEGSISSHVEQYLTVMLEGLAERTLIRDYHACYPVHEDIEMLRQAYPQIDPVKTDFILQAIYSNLDEPIPEHLLSTNQEDSTTGHAGHLEPENTDSQSQPDPPETRDSKALEDIKQESLISEVRDILPHLGDGFILKCLQHYEFNSETVINRVLEGNLDPSLQDIDQSLPIIPEDPLDNKFLETGIARLNVFDGDEFDIMNRDDVDVSKIHVGKKKEKYKDLKQMLDDKSEVRGLADMYSKYDLVCDETSIYDDEYDDTYDSDFVPPAEPSTEDERRPFVTPRALRARERVEDSDDESEDEAPDAPGAASTSYSTRNRMDFCVNPEEVRARREASYQSRRGRGGRPPPQPKERDVVGKPKGQGQAKEVLHIRDKKEKQKSSRGNHNRRQGAQWKRTQGMMPS